MKKWQILSDRVENQFVPKIGDTVKIISVALNAFRGPIVNDGQDFEPDSIAKIMKEQLLKTNTLLDDINHSLISSRSHWKNLDDQSIEFPVLELNELPSLFFGIYQIKQSRTYTEEHLADNGNYIVQVAPENSELSQCRIQSRHSNAVRYYA